MKRPSLPGFIIKNSIPLTYGSILGQMLHFSVFLKSWCVDLTDLFCQTKYVPLKNYIGNGVHFGSMSTKFGAIQRRLAWPLHKDDMAISEVFHILK